MAVGTAPSSKSSPKEETLDRAAYYRNAHRRPIRLGVPRLDPRSTQGTGEATALRSSPGLSDRGNALSRSRRREARIPDRGLPKVYNSRSLRLRRNQTQPQAPGHPPNPRPTV